MLHLNTFFIREQVALLKLTDTYDILDPMTGASIGLAREATPVWARLLRLVVQKQALPIRIEVRGTDGGPATLMMEKGFSLFRPTVEVSDGVHRKLGTLKRRLFSWRGYFRVLDPDGGPLGEVRGDWKGWNFRLEDQQGQLLGVITKKWSGLGKELFTSADQYVVQAEGAAAANKDLKALLLAAALAIDIIYKEQKG